MTFTPNRGLPSGGAGMSGSYLSRSQVRFHPCYRFFEHHLARQPAVHCLGRIESPRFEQLVCRRSAAAPSEITAASLARFHTALDLAADSAEQGRVLEIREGMRGGVAECKAL